MSFQPGARPWRPRAIAVTAWMIGALAVAGCPVSDSSEPIPDPPVSDLTLADFASPGSLGVGVRTVDTVDTTRVTPANGDEPELPTRSLTVEVWYPAEQGSADAAARDADPLTGPHPLLIWGHGFTSTRGDNPALARHLASHGYIVAAIEFPLSSRNTAGSPNAGDVINQPDDVSFVLDQMLDDPAWSVGRVAVGGLSLGGLTTLLVGLHPAVSDARIEALLPLTPATCILGVEVLQASSPPMLLVHGTSDAILPYEAHALPFVQAMQGPIRFASLTDGTHTGFADLTEELLEGLDHADTLGCGQIAGAVEDGEPVTTDPVDGDGDVLSPQCALPCEDVDSLPRGMRPSRQGRLTRALAHAFLDAELMDDEQAALWLDAGVGLQNEDVTMEGPGQ